MDRGTATRHGTALPLAGGAAVEDPLALVARMAREGVHELAAQAHGDAPACTGLALAALAPARAGAVLWVFQGPARRAHGMLSARGARAMGFDPGRLIAVRAERLLDALWTVEEGLGSGAVAAVVAEVEDASFTATRRLSLAAARGGVPAFLALPHRREGATAAATRWRVASRPAAPDPWDAAAPGAMRWQARLERARIAPALAGRTVVLEFDAAAGRLAAVPERAAQSSAAARPAPATSPAAGWRRAG